ncbi:hypothetical protein MMC09_000498 [Bachmanniomyces sp. S44760]|nr:hypothetical protein [Bachmanniomyces sp. S44760]
MDSTPQQMSIPQEKQAASSSLPSGDSAPSLSSTVDSDEKQSTKSDGQERAGQDTIEAQTSESHTQTEQTSGQEQEKSDSDVEATGAASNNEPRKCWICFQDETEDTPTSSVWRSPCPCALTAHEACLLDWVADLEAPNQRKRTGSSPRIQCPQCKAKITVARPRSLIVDGVNAAERVAGQLVVPGIVISLAGTIFTGCWVHGLSSIFLVFGTEDASTLLNVKSGEGISARWGFGIPLIPVVLVLSRTTIADGVLPILPILFFATQIPEAQNGSLDLWSPSAAMTMASLPYLRGAYNALYKGLFAEREKKWIKEVRPRAGETGDDEDAGGGQGGDGGDNAAEEDVGFELNVEVEIFEEEENVADLADIINQQPAELLGIGQAAGPGAENDQNANQAHPQPAQAQRQNNLIVSTSQVADSIIGALLFPTVSAAMGILLKALLPKKWTTFQRLVDRQRPTLLQTQWGRSVVGGCLFVVMKDSLLLYSRYRVAQDHRKRRIVDYDRKKDKSKGRGSR